MSTITQKLAGNFTDLTRPKMYAHPMLNDGSLFLVDFTDGYCNPNAVGALTPGMTFKNLVDGGPNATMVAQVSGTAIAVANDTGKTGIVTGGSVSNLVNPPLIRFDAAIDTGQAALMYGMWVKLDANAPFVANSFMFGDTTADTSFRKIGLYAGITGRQPQMIQRLSGTTYSNNPPADNVYNGLVTHIAMTWSAGQLATWFNGVLFSQVAGIPAGSMLTTTGQGPRLEFMKGGKYYQVYGERLDLSGKTTAQAVANDYAVNGGKFT